MTSRNHYTVQLNIKLPKRNTWKAIPPSHATPPPQAHHSYQQHMADYVPLFMEEGEELTLGEDPAAPLIMEVCHHVPLLT